MPRPGLLKCHLPNISSTTLYLTWGTINKAEVQEQDTFKTWSDYGHLSGLSKAGMQLQVENRSFQSCQFWQLHMAVSAPPIFLATHRCPGQHMRLDIRAREVQFGHFNSCQSDSLSNYWLEKSNLTISILAKVATVG